MLKTSLAGFLRNSSGSVGMVWKSPRRILSAYFSRSISRRVRTPNLRSSGRTPAFDRVLEQKTENRRAQAQPFLAHQPENNCGQRDAGRIRFKDTLDVP